MNEDNQLNCADKMAFDSQKEAEASAVAIEHQRGINLKAYKCRECELWHLSSRVYE